MTTKGGQRQSNSLLLDRYVDFFAKKWGSFYINVLTLKFVVSRNFSWFWTSVPQPQSKYLFLAKNFRKWAMANENRPFYLPQKLQKEIEMQKPQLYIFLRDMHLFLFCTSRDQHSINTYNKIKGNPCIFVIWWLVTLLKPLHNGTFKNNDKEQSVGNKT